MPYSHYRETLLCFKKLMKIVSVCGTKKSFLKIKKFIGFLNNMELNNKLKLPPFHPNRIINCHFLYDFKYIWFYRGNT